MHKSRKTPPLIFVLGYMLVGFIYIILSDALLEILVADVHLINKLQSVKGTAFIILTALLLYFLLRYYKTTDKINLLQELEKTRNLTWTFLEISPTPIALCNNLGIVTFINAANAQMIGRPANEIKGQSIFSFVYTHDYENSVNAFRTLMAKGSLKNFEIRLLVSENKILDVIVDAVFIDNDYIIVFTKDITENKNIQRELINSNQEYIALNEELEKSLETINKINQDLVISKARAEESNTLKSAFLNNLSHEIRTPMNAIIGFTELLKDKDPESMDEYIRIIQANGNYLLRIINDILDISHIETGQIVLYKKSCSLRKIFNDIESNTRVVLASKTKFIQTHFTLEIPEEEDLVLMDEIRFSKVINHLMSNAVKFTERGLISLKVRMENHILDIAIKDTGIGISADKLPVIFERFRQAEESVTRSHEGIGLGLSIAKGICELMGGHISVSSEPGKGTEFRLSIPMEAGRYNGQISSETPRKHVLTGKTLLIAEDIESNFNLIKAYLQDTEITLIRAKNGVEAISRFIENRDISLILMDIKMPDMSGYDATEAIRKMDKKIPIIAHTAYASPNDYESSLNAGCSDYLPKPYSREEFINMLRKHLS